MKVSAQGNSAKICRRIASIALILCLTSRPGFPESPKISTPMELRVVAISGEGAMISTTSRTPQSIVVRVEDGRGRPVEDALVRFVLPADGSAGAFANSLNTDVITTGADGIAATAFRASDLPGEFEIRVMAEAGDARGTIGLKQTLFAPGEEAGAGEIGWMGGKMDVPGKKRTWLWLLLGAGAAGGLAVGLAGGGASPASNAPTPQPGVQIGQPNITVGRP